MTLSKPKPLIEFGNKPQLMNLLLLLKNAGVTEVVLAINYRPEVMQEFLDMESTRDLGITIHVRRESEPLGTAGPVRAA